MDYLDPTFLISTLGLIGVFVVIFAESGTLLGLFFPGDSLLFLAGVFAMQGYFPLWLLVVGSMIAAIAGDSVGYWFGTKVGPKIFFKEESVFFKKSYITKTQEFYAKHGKKTIAIARFIPIVRTFAPIMAGVGSMQYSIFLFWNTLGGVLWVLSFTLGGAFLSAIIPNSEQYLGYITFGIVVVSLVPAGYQLIRTIRR